MSVERCRFCQRPFFLFCLLVVCVCVCVWEVGCGLCGSVVVIFLLDLGSKGIIFFDA